ncbi:hypothetical protein [Dyadobacter sediminis]|uniref:Lipocalin-like domain-containing protein n=1 Tax=Dyadobacter sediminis TaxID=1493691 RepID=A0A5R9KII5_9BACT|nr:hypothetical protein [Dyadobacter sediminis]TLU96015.1 hypothetical protein FEM55_02370 [Dyadobacter sediminis]GGB78560.1 hypothetical protein GCM10011325_02590 [Dyadobacter sediminis]
MKKLIFLSLVVFMGSCKDNKEEVTPESDYTSEFIGNYWTNTIDGPASTRQEWEVSSPAKNQLRIIYSKNIEVKAAGTTLTLVQNYNLVNVQTTAYDSFTINEVVDVEQSNGKPLKQKVEGVSTKVINASGIPQINITLKLTDSETGASSEEYLEFKKK